MAGSGIGRGRGWLNINKNQTMKPGSVPTAKAANFDYDTNNTVTTGPKLNPKYSKILANINLFDENDDGILLNQKLRHFIEELNKTCHSSEDVLECFKNILDNCLYDIDFATKLICIATTVNVHNLTIHEVRIRSLLIDNFQKNFESGKQLQSDNPTQFRITVKMLGDYFHKVRLGDGTPVKVFAAPILQYLEMLLESNNEVDFELFTVQLFMNGNELKNQCPAKLTQMLLQIRNLLAHNEKLSSASKLWLLLALDISNNRFGLLPKEVHQFYITQLGDDAMSLIKKLNTELTIQVSYQNMKLDSHQSNVNVLQKAPVNKKKPNWESGKKEEKKPTERTEPLPNLNSSQSFSSDGSFNNIGTWEQPKEKTPRPILGVGARLKQEEKNSDLSEWNESSSGWENKKEDGNWGNKHKKNIPKGWEHDDRIENDYN